MSATNWTPALIALGLSLGVGIFVLMRSRSGAPLPAVESTRRDELKRQKEDLYRLLAEHGSRRDESEPTWLAERARLELAAAGALRALELQSVAEEPAPAIKAGTSWGDRHPRLAGAAWGAGIVLFLGGLGLAVQQGSRPRGEGGSMTGGSAMGEAASPASPASPVLSAGQLAKLAALRAAADAAPNDVAARNALGHALLAAGKLMDAFKEAEAVRTLAPDDPEARTHQAVVLLAVGDTTMATAALDKILVLAPEFGEALAYRGMLHLQAGENAQAIIVLDHATTADPSLAESIAPLLASARRGEPMAAPAGPAESAPSPAATAAATAAGPPSPDDIHGTITLASGSVEPGETVFVLARAAGVDRGPPTWVTRLQATTFPMEFTLGPKNAMMGGATPPELVVTARVDRDGNAMTRAPGDLEGKSAAIAPGTGGITVVLSPVQ